MNQVGHDEIVLTSAEKELLVELLERERRELHSGIHHAQSSVYRDKLRERMDLVFELMRRLE